MLRDKHGYKRVTIRNNLNRKVIYRLDIFAVRCRYLIV